MLYNYINAFIPKSQAYIVLVFFSFVIISSSILIITLATEAVLGLNIG